MKMVRLSVTKRRTINHIQFVYDDSYVLPVQSLRKKTYSVNGAINQLRDCIDALSPNLTGISNASSLHDGCLPKPQRNVDVSLTPFLKKPPVSGGATPGRARSNDLAEELPPWLPLWLNEISINFINMVHKQINLCATKCRDSYILYPFVTFCFLQTVHTKYFYLLILL